MRLSRTHLLRLVILCLCAIFLAPVAFSRPAYASSALHDSISITSETDKVSFPDSIDFQISASDSSNTITSATIFITFNTRGNEFFLNGGYQEQHAVTVSSGRSITTDWKEDTSGDNFHQPGTLVSYYWELSDSAGNVSDRTLQNFTTVDTRFNWQPLSAGLLTVNWYDESVDFGQSMLGKASENVQRISSVLGGEPKQPINLWIYKTNTDFQGSLASGSPEWVGGEALPVLSEAFIVAASTSDYTVVRDMPYELTHLIFHQLTAQGILSPPTWFDEGLAVYNQIYHEPEMTQTLNDAITHHTLIPFSQLGHGFPANPDQAYLAYAQSWNLVSYMYKTFGQPHMGLLIQKMNNPGPDFNQDLEQALGMDQATLEQQWLQRLTGITTTPSQPLSHPSASDNTSLWFMLLGILLVLVSLIGITLIMVSVRHNRQKALAVQTAEQIMAFNTANSWQHPKLPDTGPLPYMPPPTYNEWDYPEADSDDQT